MRVSHLPTRGVQEHGCTARLHLQVVGIALHRLQCHLEDLQRANPAFSASQSGGSSGVLARLCISHVGDKEASALEGVLACRFLAFSWPTSYLMTDWREARSVLTKENDDFLRKRFLQLSLLLSVLVFPIGKSKYALEPIHTRQKHEGCR